MFNVDVLEYMRALPENKYDLAIADFPYGLPKDSSNGRGKLKDRVFNKGHISDWDVVPPKEVFDELFRVSKNQIIWGGNYFDLPPTRGFVVWDKCQPWENFSQVEYAWTSFECPAKLFQFDNRTGDKYHPCQKPIELYAYLLKIFAKEGDFIFDPMAGSQSSRIAAYKMNFPYEACEIDAEYYKIGCERFERECLGISKTRSGKTIVEPSLFDV